MSARLRTLSLLAALGSPALGCSANPAGLHLTAPQTGPHTMPEPLTLTAADQNTPYPVAAGQDVLLRLEENPTTGYRWSLAFEPAGAVDTLDSPYHPGGSAPGAAGLREFHLRTKSPGKVHLHLKLWREWAGEGSVVQRLEFTLQVSS